MIKELLLQMMSQNRITNMSLGRVSPENADFRLNEKTASIGFIYRHIAETLNMFGSFFDLPTNVTNTTMGFTDTGQGQDIIESKRLIAAGFQKFQRLIEESADSFWLEEIDTPFFGKVSRFRLFSHVMFHNSHHAGQVSLTLARGNKI